MEGVVDEHAVEQHLVLDGRSAADVQLPALVPCRDKPGQHLKRLHQIRGPAEARNALDVRRANGLHRRSDLGGLFLAIGTHLCAFQRHHLGCEQQIARQHLALSDFDRLFHGFVLETGHHKGVLSGRDSAQAVIPFHVAGHPVGGSFKRHGGKHHRFSRGLRLQKAFDCALGRSHNAPPHHHRESHNAPQRRRLCVRGKGFQFLHARSKIHQAQAIRFRRSSRVSDDKRSRNRSTNNGKANGDGLSKTQCTTSRLHIPCSH